MPKYECNCSCGCCATEEGKKTEGGCLACSEATHDMQIVPEKTTSGNFNHRGAFYKGLPDCVFSLDPPGMIEPRPKPVASRSYEEGYFEGLRTAASTVRHYSVMHGDQYASYYAPSTDASELSKAILSLIPEEIR